MEKLYLRLLSNFIDFNNGPTKVAKLLFATLLFCFSHSAFAQIAPITGPTGTCVGNCTTLSDATPGGVWTSSNTAVATIDPSSGQVCGVTMGSVTITYSVSPNIAIYTFTVFAAPPPILGVHNMCAWFDTMHVSDANTTGLYSSTGATTINIFGPGFTTTGLGIVHAQAPGLDTLLYSLPGGCYALATFTVFPIPTPILGRDTLCVGDTMQVTSTPSGYTWSSSNPLVASIVPPNTSMPGVVAGVNAGTIMLTYRNPTTGCFVDTPVTVLPVPAPIHGDSMLCLGHCVTFTDATTGGVWSSSNATVAAVGSTGSVCGMGLGTAIITYQFNTGTHGCIQIYTVTVNPDPAPITGPSNVCVGSCINLTDPTSGGSWSSLVPSVATVDPVTGQVCGLAYGNTIITYTLGTSCFVTYLVRVDTAPGPIVGPPAVCCSSIGSVLYTDPTPGGVWSGGSPCIYVDVAGYVTCLTGASLPCTGIITYSIPSTGCLVTDTIIANPPPSPIIGSHTLCGGAGIIDSTLLTDATSGGTWSSSRTTVATVGSSTGEVYSVGVGSTTITYTLSTGCFATFNVTVLAPPTAISPLVDTICRGDSLLLSVTPPGGTWTTSTPLVDSMGTTSGEVYGLASGVGFVTYTIGSGTGCNLIFTIHVNPSEPIVGADTVCQGQQIILSDAVTGVWSSSPPGIVNVDTTGHVYGARPGTAIVTFTNSPYGCIRTHTVTVLPNKPIIGPDTICFGSPVIFIDSIDGTWTSSLTSVATVLRIDTVSALVTPANPSGGTTVITHLAASGCYSYHPLTVLQLPDPIIGPDSLCQGDSTVFVDPTPLTGGVWSSTPPSVATIDSFSGVLTGVGPGTASITFTLPSGCFVTDSVKINPVAPITGIDSVCVGATTSLSDAVPGGTWSSGNTGVATVDTAGVVYGVSQGTSIITYFTPGACPAYDTITVNPVPTITPTTATFCQYSTITLLSSPPGGTWSSGNPSVATVDTAGNVTGLIPGSATVTYTLSTGCYATAALVIDTTPTITGTADICITFNTTLTGNPTGGKWTSSDTLVATIDSVTGFVSSVSVGTTTISYILPTGCFAVSIVTVHGPPTVYVTASDTLMICRGATDTLFGHGAVNYYWSPAYALNTTVGTPVLASPTVTTTYTVIGADAYNCRDTITYTVAVDTELNHIRITGRDSICRGTCDTLRATGRLGSYFNWHPATGLSCTICDTVIACPDSTIRYTAVAIDNFGCKDSVRFTVTVMPIPVFTITPWPVVVCKGTPLQIFAFGAFNYVWTPPYGLSCDTCANPVAVDTSNMIYLLKGYSKFGCVDSILVPVSVLDTNVDLFSNDTIICIGGTAQLFAISHSIHGNLDIPSYLWAPAGSLDNPTISNPKATPTATTIYTVIVTENACFKDTATITVTVDPIPIVLIKRFPAGNPLVAGTADSLIAEVTNDVISKFEWTPAATIRCDTCDTAIATPIVNTTYMVKVTSNHGCIAYDTVTIDIFCDQSQVFIPNTFTPNGDGVNDRFFVSGKGLTMIKNFMIYNRWGQLVYEAHNIPPNSSASGWDGTYKGYVLEPDVFVVIVDAVCELGNAPFHYQTNVSIVR
jgi:gliding motility-associated-like protein